MIIQDIWHSQPELCLRALKEFLNILQGQIPGGLKSEPSETTGEGRGTSNFNCHMMWRLLVVISCTHPTSLSSWVGTHYAPNFSLTQKNGLANQITFLWLPLSNTDASFTAVRKLMISLVLATLSQKDSTVCLRKCTQAEHKTIYCSAQVPNCNLLAQVHFDDNFLVCLLRLLWYKRFDTLYCCWSTLGLAAFLVAHSCFNFTSISSIMTFWRLLITYHNAVSLSNECN